MKFTIFGPALLIVMLSGCVPDSTQAPVNTLPFSDPRGSLAHEFNSSTETPPPVPSL